MSLFVIAAFSYLSALNATGIPTDPSSEARPAKG